MWIWAPESRMKARTQVRPPASNTDPASRVQTSSRTLMHCSARSREVLLLRSTTSSRVQMALTAPSTATILRVHSADTSR